MMKRLNLRSPRLLLGGLLLAGALFSALAGTARADEDDHARAREALERGEILPLLTILQRATGHRPGEVVEVELERDDGRWLYELKLLTPEGVLVEMELDAATGALLEFEQDDEDDRED